MHIFNNKNCIVTFLTFPVKLVNYILHEMYTDINKHLYMYTIIYMFAFMHGALFNCFFCKLYIKSFIIKSNIFIIQ